MQEKWKQCLSILSEDSAELRNNIPHTLRDALGESRRREGRRASPSDGLPDNLVLPCFLAVDCEVELDDGCFGVSGINLERSPIRRAR